MKNKSSSKLNVNANNSSRKSRSKTKTQDSSKNKAFTDCENNRASKILPNDFKNEIVVSKPISLNSIHYLSNRLLGRNWFTTNCDKMQAMVITDQLKKFGLYQMNSPFVRRITYLTWHPSCPQFLASGSKGGELILHNMITGEEHFCPGTGPGGSIVGLKFSPEDPHTAFTTSISGNIRREDFTGKNSKNLLSTSTFENWFSCLDICYKRNYLLTGDCNGYGFLLDTNGNSVWNAKRKLHTQKVTHCEFSHCDPNIIVTSSVDRTVKLWDIRMVSEQNLKPKPLRVFQHLKPVNSACFSSSNGLRLLTTDQHSELRVYSSPCWNEVLTIKHPHRHFQHITSIKAAWHPMKDIIVVGRYPDDNVFTNDTRSIDFYDASSGELMHRINSPSGNIVALNAFNCLGDILASAAGYNLMFLKNEDIFKHPENFKQKEADECVPNLPKRKKSTLSTAQNKNLKTKHSSK